MCIRDRYIDLYPKNLKLKELNCAENGILGVMSGMIGLIQATETIKIILGIGSILNGYILKYNLLKTSFHKIKCSPIKHNNKNIVKQVTNEPWDSTLDLKTIKNIHRLDLIIVDIRNQLEFQENHRYKAINIPAKQFQAKRTIQFIQSYLYHYQIILSCNNITTSLTISNLLKTYEISTYVLKNR